MAETTVEGKTCKAIVKDDDGQSHPCGTKLPKGQPECRNKSRHMHKMRTGFCADGFCEGTQPVDLRGTPAKTCEFWQMCPCSCHTNMDKMFLMTGEPRRLVENPKYTRPKSHLVMPTLVDALESTPNSIPQAAILTAPTPPRFTPTPTGKRARGQLEQQVLDVCTAFTKGQLDVEDLTPAVIAMEIDEVEPPSVGAIGAVFDRWVSLGFARCEKKPVRFVSFTVDGMMHGLDYLKAKAKRDSKMKQAADNRGTLRRK